MTYSLYLNGITVSGTNAITINDGRISGLTLNEPTESNHPSTKGYVDTQIASLVDSAPATLNTLNELSNALGDDNDFATTVTNAIGLRATIDNPTFTGTALIPVLTVTDTVTVSGPITAQNNLTVNGVSTLNGNVTLGDTSADTVTVSGPITAQNSLTVNGNVTLGDTSADEVIVNGTTSFVGAVTATTQQLHNDSTLVATTKFVKEALDNFINGQFSDTVAGLNSVQAYLVALHYALYNHGEKPDYPPTYTNWTISSIVVNQTLTLTSPRQAPFGVTVSYTIVSGSNFISLSGDNNGSMTGTAAGTAVIQASWQVDGVTSSVNTNVTVADV